MRLEQWAVTYSAGTIMDPYKAPELYHKGLCGAVYNNPEFNDGEIITTTRLVKIERQEDGKVLATTRSGSVYELGEVNPLYEEFHPNSLERLLKQDFSHS